MTTRRIIAFAGPVGSDATVKAIWRRPLRNSARPYTCRRTKPLFNWPPDKSWKLAYETSFTRGDDLKGWTQQGWTGHPYRMKEFRAIPDGLLMETPDTIDVETRTYLWSSAYFEGDDLAVKFEFRPEKPTGLAVWVVRASGM